MPNPRRRFVVIRIAVCAIVLLLGLKAKGQDITTGLRGLWKLDETSGTTATDYSGQTANGTFVGSPLLGDSGRFGKSTNFSGSGGTLDRVSLPNTVLNALSSVTVSFWIRTTDAGFHTIVSAANASFDNEYRIAISGTALTVEYHNAANAALWTLGSVNNGNWHHVAVVSNQSTGQTTVYFDGASLGSQSAPMPASLSVSSGGLFLGQDQDTLGGTWDATQRMIGDLDQVRFYNRALTATDVAVLYAEDSPVAYWKLNETTGTSASDSSGYSRTGTVTGTASWVSAVLNNGFSFNGATKIQATGLMGSARNVSVAAWANLTTADISGSEIISLGDHFFLRLDDGGVAKAGIYTGSAWQTVSISGTYAGTGWHHFAAVFDDDGDTFYLYIDGVLAASASNTNSISYSGLGANTLIGCHGNGNTNYDFTGAIDDVRVYNYALSATEVAKLFGLVGRWNLNETSGTTAADSTIFARNGTVTGGASWSTDCGGMGTFDFNGSTQYISINNDADFQPTTMLSIAGWVKGDTWKTGTDVNPILRKGDANPNNYQLSISDGRLEMLLDGNDESGFRGNTVLNTGQWYHVAGVWNGATVKLYVNGVLDNTPAARTGTILTDTRPLYTGGRPGADFHDGMLRDVRLYNRPLTAAEVQRLAGLVGYWQFSEGSGASAADSSGQANNATLSGGATWTNDCAGNNNALQTDGIGAMAQTVAPFSPPSEGSVAFWMRGAGTVATRGRLMGIGGDWEIRQEPNGALSFDMGGSPFVGNEPFSTIDPVNTNGKWYHIVAVFSDVDNSYSVYINGQLRTSGISPVDLIPQAAGVLTFGIRAGTSEYWKGALRDVRIYNRKLCPTEIAALYGLVGYWKLNEASGTTASDSSGLGYNGTVTGTVNWTAAKTGNGFQFDYTNGNDYIKLPNNATLDNVQEGNYTLAAWFKPLSTPPGTGSANNADYAILLKAGWHCGLSYSHAQQFEFGHYLTGNVWHGTGTWSNTYPPGSWHHVVAVVNRTAGTITLYLDNVVKGTDSFTPNSVARDYGTQPWYIGIADPTYGTYGWAAHGVADDVRIYSRALCPAEVQDVYQSGNPFGGVKITKWVEIQ
jgi:hypothetical protein